MYIDIEKSKKGDEAVKKLVMFFHTVKAKTYATNFFKIMHLSPIRWFRPLIEYQFIFSKLSCCQNG